MVEGTNLTLDEIRDKFRKKVEALGLPASTVSETRDILECLDAVSEELNVWHVKGVEQAAKIGLLQANVDRLEEVNARRTLNAIKRICPDCGDDMCGDNHDVCYKCKATKQAQLLRKCVHLLNVAFDYEGDVFGTEHNDAMDVVGEVAALLDPQEPESKEDAT